MPQCDHMQWAVQAFEWYGEWKQLKPLVLPVLKGHNDILVLGCGNSDLSADM